MFKDIIFGNMSADLYLTCYAALGKFYKVCESKFSHQLDGDNLGRK